MSCDNTVLAHAHLLHLLLAFPSPVSAFFTGHFIFWCTHIMAEQRYELAYHDWTQIEFCGCTRFNMTRTGNQIDDAFTTKCPYQNDEGETYVINMREEVNMATPGSFHEHAFYNTWRNKVQFRFGRSKVCSALEGRRGNLCWAEEIRLSSVLPVTKTMFLW